MITSILLTEGDTKAYGWASDYFTLNELIKSMIKGKIPKYDMQTLLEKEYNGIFNGKTMTDSGRMNSWYKDLKVQLEHSG